MENTPFLSDQPSRELPRDKRVGREISFGIQQTLACWATDFIDPMVGEWYQNKHGHKDHKVTKAHTFGGEVAGDSAAFFVYMAVKRMFTTPVDALIGGVKKALDPVYNRLGRKTIRQWAETNHIEQDDPRYQHKLDMYKEFQAENLVDTSIIATSSLVVNVAAQRKLGNKQAIPVIVEGKLLGTLATVATMLGLRTAAPTSMKTLDAELSDRYFARVARGIGKVFGVNPSHITPVVPAAFEGQDVKAMVSLADAPISHHVPGKEKRAGFITMLKRDYAGNPADEQAVTAFLEEQKKICDAYILALHPRGAFARTLSEQYHSALRHLQSADAPDGMAGKLLKKSARVGVQSILINRRDDMVGFKKLLNDADFVQEVQKALAENTPEPKKALPDAKQEILIESLVQTRGPLGREPAVHIFANAKGQIIEHQALSMAYDTQGEAVQVLAQQLQKSLPDIAARRVQEMATGYMRDRKAAADLVVQDLRLDGHIVNEAIRRSEKIRLREGEGHVEKLVQQEKQENAALGV